MTSDARYCVRRAGFEVDGTCDRLLSVVLVPSAPMKDDQALDRRILQYDLSQLLLLLGHGGEGDGLRRLRDASGVTPVSEREESLGNRDVENNGKESAWPRR